MTDSATMSAHEQARKDDEDDRVHAESKRFIPECALEFVCTEAGMKKLLDADDAWIAADLVECFQNNHRMLCEDFPHNAVAVPKIYRAIDRLMNYAIDLAKDQEEVHIAAQKRITDKL